MPLTLIQAPAAEPVTLAEAKTFLRVDSDVTDDDSLITMMISVARRYAEDFCKRSFITQRWRVTMDAFPGRLSPAMVPAGVQFGVGPTVLAFERGPVQSVDKIGWVDMAGATQQVVNPSAPDYAIDLSGLIGRMSPGFGRIWPITLPQIGAAWVEYTAGYGTTAASVPPEVRNWMQIRISTLYNNREEVALLQRGTIAPLPYVDYMLDAVRTPMVD